MNTTRLRYLLTFCIVFASRASGGSEENPIPETYVRHWTEKEQTTTHVYFENLQSSELTVTIELELVNVEANVPSPCTQTLSPKERRCLLSLSAPVCSKSEGSRFTYTYYATLGSFTAEHDDAYVYVLPYAPGKAFEVSQGYDGSYSHFGQERYALDWRMPVGTPVYAARGGDVVGVKADSNVGGDDSKYDHLANYVLIKHADRTLGQYVHLRYGGVKVCVGERVEAGDLIGFSGSTGHSTGAHLHFSVFKTRDGKCRWTIPVRFKTSGELTVTLEAGKSYEAPPKGPIGHFASTEASPRVQAGH